MIIYISGPMTGYPDLNFPAFHAAAAELRSKGFEVISPAEIELPQYPKGYKPKDEADRKSMWEAFMKADIAEMMKTDTVATLPGWEKSDGAVIEVGLANKLGMRIYKVDELFRKIEAGDTVYHKPCDEKWYVLGVNYTTGRLCVAGWPHTIADIADCTLIKKGTGITEEEAAARQKMFGGGWE